MVQLEDEQVERDIWRKRGPVGKLHNAVKYIRNTPQRREDFEDIARGELHRQKDRIAVMALPDEEAEFVSRDWRLSKTTKRDGTLYDPKGLSPQRSSRPLHKAGLGKASQGLTSP